MKEHFSVAGTTCWFCGHEAGAGGRARKVVGEMSYLACRNCHHAPAGEERERRDADVEGLRKVLEGGSWVPGYWTQGGFALLVEQWKGQDPQWLRELKVKEYQDEFAAETFARQQRERREYDRNYYLKRREEQAQFYLKVGNEQAKVRYELMREERRRAYREDGGRERAAAAYLERKALEPPKPTRVKRVLTEEEREAKRLAACAYAKEWYQRKKERGNG